MRRSLVALAGLAVVTASACGGGSEEDKARDVVKDYVQAIAGGDENKVCDTLTRESKERFDRAKTSCEDAYKNFGRSLRPEHKEKLNELDPKVTVKGDRATTRVPEPPLEGELRLAKENGDWKISIR